MNSFELIVENTDEQLVEAKRVWARRGKKIKRMVRCTGGKRKGRVVATTGACTAAIDVRKRYLMKRIRKRFNSRIVRKSKKTKKFNQLSRRLKVLNKTMNRK